MVHLTQLVWKAGELYPSRRNTAHLPMLTHLDRLTCLCSLTLINGDHDNPVILPGLVNLPGLPRLRSLQLQGVGVSDAHLHDIATSLTCLTRSAPLSQHVLHGSSSGPSPYQAHCASQPLRVPGLPVMLPPCSQIILVSPFSPHNGLRPFVVIRRPSSS